MEALETLHMIMCGGGHQALADDGVPRNPYPVVCGDVALDEPPNKMKWMREKPVQAPKIPRATKPTQSTGTGNHSLGINGTLPREAKEVSRKKVKVIVNVESE